MSRRIAVFGGSFNPPGNHHVAIVRELARRFDEVIVLPCGPRPDKSSTNEVDPVHRAAMVDMAFRGIANVTVDLFDLENASFTRTIDMQARLADAGEIWHAVGSELVEGGSQGLAAIQTSWHRGLEVWRDLRFVVFVRPGHAIGAADLPPHGEIIGDPVPGASTEVRERCFRRQRIDDLVPARVAAYIDRFMLYRGRLPQRAAQVVLGEVRPHLLVDEGNARAVELARSYTPHELHDANCLIVIGGDGHMLRVIREHWRQRLPIIGVNAGHRGFLLNDPRELKAGELAGAPLVCQHLPLLYVEARVADRVTRTLAFNDAWVERATAQTAWIDVAIDGVTRLAPLVADGVLVATAAGSTAYARAMGATPLRADTPELLLVGSNVVEPVGFRSVHLSLDSEVLCTARDLPKRRLAAFADGVPLGDVDSLVVRKSRIAAVELAFSPRHDLSAKLSALIFPAL